MTKSKTMIMRTMTRARRGSAGALLLATVATLAMVVGGFADQAAAQQRCRGTKRWYAGKCRYSEDIAALERARARRRAETRKVAERADRAACREARAGATKDAWRDYIERHPNGQCNQEARRELAKGASPSAPKKRDDPQGAESPVPPATSAPPASAAPTASPTAAPKPVEPTPAPVAKVRGSAAMTISIVGFVLGGIGVAVGTGAGVASSAKVNELEEYCTQGCPPDREAEIQEALALAHVSTASFIVAAAGAGLGVVGRVIAAGPAAAPADRGGGVCGASIPGGAQATARIDF